MQEVGNVKAKEKYEAKVPACWVPPKPHSKRYVGKLVLVCVLMDNCSKNYIAMLIACVVNVVSR